MSVERPMNQALVLRVTDLDQITRESRNLPQQPYLFNWREDDLRPKPFLKWVGGKSHLLPVLHQYVPKQFGRYFEPFLVGANFLRLSPMRISYRAIRG
jgi:hypothetical protein